MRRIVLIVLLTAVLVVGAAGIALATPATTGVTSSQIAGGTLDPITIKTKIGDWESEMETKGLSNLIVVENRVPVGGNFGWHSHPGPSLVIVKSGTSTFYRGDDPTCTGQEHPAGSAYVDPGDGSVHTARNNGSVELVLISIRLLRPGVSARIDAPKPANCDF